MAEDHFACDWCLGSPSQPVMADYSALLSEPVHFQAHPTVKHLHSCAYAVKYIKCHHVQYDPEAFISNSLIIIRMARRLEIHSENRVVPEHQQNAWCSWLWADASPPHIGQRRFARTYENVSRQQRNSCTSNPNVTSGPSAEDSSSLQQQDRSVQETSTCNKQPQQKEPDQQIPLCEQPCDGNRRGLYKRDCCHGEFPPNHCHYNCCNRHCHWQSSCRCDDCKDRLERRAILMKLEKEERDRKIAEKLRRRADPNYVPTWEDRIDDAVVLAICAACVGFVGWGVYRIVKAACED